jgi:uncharacterized phage infection (PIP) family protein YhgE
MNDSDDSARFTIRDQDNPPDPIYMADADNLRLEKINARVTLISILIPCLLVVILAVAYLDIKHRVIRTQTSGSMGVQNLSKDLESRFSSLSLKQAKMAEQLAENTQALNTATAAMQVNLKKAATEFKRITDSKPDQSALTAISTKMDTSVADLEKEIADLNTAYNKFDEELASQILLMAQGLKKDQGRLADIEANIQRLDTEKLNKESMDLALGLERLGLQEMVKDRIRELEKKLAAVNKKIDALNQRLDAQAKQASISSPPVAAPAPSPTPSLPSDPNPSSTNIVEQTIN